MITNTVKLNAVIEVLKGAESKSQIANKYKISLRSLGRYIEKYQSEAVKFVKEPVMENVENEKAEDQLVETTPTTNVMSFMVQQGTVEPIKEIKMKAKTVGTTRKPKGSGPSVKGTVIEIMTQYKNEGKTTKEYRDAAVAEISAKTNLDVKLASKYYAGYKKMVFGS